MSERPAESSRTPSPWPLAALVLGTLAAAVSVPRPPAAEFAATPVDPALAAAAPPIFESQVLPAPHPACHAASLAPRPGGGALVAWFSGTREGAKDVEILMASVAADGAIERSWSALTRDDLAAIVGRRIRKLGNPVVTILPSGAIRLLVVSVSLGGWSGSAVNLLVSRGDGERGSWEGRRLILSPFLNFSTLVKAPPVALAEADGSIGWGVPAYREFTSTEGQWIRLGGLGGFEVLDVVPMPQDRPALQPAVVPLDGRRAVAALRDGGRADRRIRWASTDSVGERWAAGAARDLANPGAAVAMVALPDGSLLLAANPFEDRRSELTLFRSRDEGATWSRVATVASSPERLDEFSYPSLAVDERGTVWLAYTERRAAIRLVRCTLAWLDAAEASGGAAP